MDEIELRFEALQCHLEARRSDDPVQADLLTAEGVILTTRADALAVTARPAQTEEDKYEPAIGTRASFMNQ